MTLDKIKNQSFSKETFDLLEKAIIEGQFPVGDKLPKEADLVEALGVGKYSVRNALKELENKGYIQIRRGIGSFVISNQKAVSLTDRLDDILSESSMSIITEYRLANELSIISVAMNKMTKRDFKKLETILQKMDTAFQNQDIDEHSILDQEFHMQICEMTQNDLFISTYSTITNQIREHTKQLNERYVTKYYNSSEEDVHWRLLRAIRDKDLKACEVYYKEMLMTE